MDFHPAASLFPFMQGEAFADFKADIAARGILEPIWLYEGKILDYAKCHDIQLSVDGDRLHVDAPTGAVTTELLEAMKSHKPELMRALTRTQRSDYVLVRCRDCANWNGECEAGWESSDPNHPRLCGKYVAASQPPAAS